ncbi:MAG: phage tail assembly protein [Betaproteobacteria bacterium]|nr:phage tail assembly protein [Betaproteobacteria bacterium]
MLPQDTAGAPIDLSGALHEVVEGLKELPPEFILEFAEPIPCNGNSYTCITLREPKGDQVRQAEEMLRSGPTLPHNIRNFEMHLIAKVSEAPFPVIQKMGQARINIAMQYLRLFLAYGR